MLKLVLLLLTALPAGAQIQRMDLRYEDSGCTDCAESLKNRLSRIRGVEEVNVDPSGGVIQIKLQPKNKVNFEQVRDFIEQGGSRVRSARLWATGRLAKQGTERVLEWEGARSPLVVESKEDQLRVSEAEHTFQGALKEVRPNSGRLTLIVEH